MTELPVTKRTPQIKGCTCDKKRSMGLIPSPPSTYKHLDHTQHETQTHTTQAMPPPPHTHPTPATGLTEPDTNPTSSLVHCRRVYPENELLGLLSCMQLALHQAGRGVDRLTNTRPPNPAAVHTAAAGCAPGMGLACSPAIATNRAGPTCAWRGTASEPAHSLPRQYWAVLVSD